MSIKISFKNFINRYYFVIIIAAFIIVSCDKFEQVHNKTISKLPSPSDTLIVSNIHFLADSTRLLNPLTAINVNDRYLVVNDYIDHNFLKVFSIPEFDLAYSWGRQGRGPGEFMAIPTDLGTTENNLFLFDPLSQTLKFFSVSDSSLKYIDESDLNFDGQVTPLNRIHRISNELYFADYGGDNAISSADENFEHIALQPENTKPIFTFGNYPESDLDGFEKYAKYIKTNWGKPDGTLFVTAYISADNRIKIYNARGMLKHDVIVSKPNSESNEVVNDFLYRTVKWASNKHIYFLGLYGSQEMIYNPKLDSTYNTSLEIWDWEGNPLSVYSFDKPIINFTVSEHLGKIYGYTLHSDDKVFEYSLPEIY